MKKNLRSEAAIKRWMEFEGNKYVDWNRYSASHLIELTMFEDKVLKVVAEIDLRELIKKRKPLTGIKKQMDKIVRGSKAKKNGKRK